MDKDAVIDTLRRHRRELERLGVRHAALFGSVARGEAGPDSDIDIAIDLDMARHPTVYDYVGMQQYIAGLFSGNVDVVDRAALKPGIRDRVAVDLVHAF
ncbi:MAG: nucleotidyltransferase domain-containing protein [Devosia sp.]|nr:nucleotidyltransferase domain-containing protein [Devosia sp.]